MIKHFSSDIDLDFGDRNRALALLKHHPAGIIRNGSITKHNSGVYVTRVPEDPFSNTASIDYKDAEARGYTKLDFLNVSLYAQVRSPAHLDELIAKEPDWAKLYDPEFCSKLIHINNHYNTLINMPEAVTSIPRLAMFLAIIRPAKRHLIGLPWKEVAKTIWDKPLDGYYFKKSHSISYAILIAVHMNLLCEK